MAVIYYPKNQLLYIRDTVVSASNYESIVLACSPNTVLYFDTSSMVTAASAMNLAVTASWALTASISQVFVTTTSASWASQSLSASYAPGGVSNAYVTIATSSLRWITASYLTPEQFVTIGVSASYNFTCSDVPASGQVATVTLYISNSAAFTSSLSFPSDWVFMGSVPTYISTSKAAILSLKNYGGALNVAAFTVQY